MCDGCCMSCWRITVGCDWSCDMDCDNCSEKDNKYK